MFRAFDKHFGLFFVATSQLDRKIQYHENRTFLFCLSIVNFMPECHILVLITSASSEGSDESVQMHILISDLCMHTSSNDVKVILGGRKSCFLPH